MTDAFERDHELEARLRAADPASSLLPAAPDDVARLLEDAMSNDALTESREPDSRGPGPLTWLVAAAAAVVIAGAGLFVVLQDGEEGRVPFADGEPTARTETTVTELTARGGERGRCLPPQAEAMSDNPVAFDGTVRAIEGDTVTLAPTRWYAGEATDLVTVQAPPEGLAELLVAVEFEEGGRYLVTATEGGDVMVCGFSAAYSDGLAAIYAEAFGD